VQRKRNVLEQKLSPATAANAVQQHIAQLEQNKFIYNSSLSRLSNMLY
jgi:hypothetical protein